MSKKSISTLLRSFKSKYSEPKESQLSPHAVMWHSNIGCKIVILKSIDMVYLRFI